MGTRRLRWAAIAIYGQLGWQVNSSAGSARWESSRSPADPPRKRTAQIETYVSKLMKNKLGPMGCPRFARETDGYAGERGGHFLAFTRLVGMTII